VGANVEIYKVFEMVFSFIMNELWVFNGSVIDANNPHNVQLWALCVLVV